MTNIFLNSFNSHKLPVLVQNFGETESEPLAMNMIPVPVSKFWFQFRFNKLSGQFRFNWQFYLISILYAKDHLSPFSYSLSQYLLNHHIYYMNILMKKKKRYLWKIYGNLIDVETKNSTNSGKEDPLQILWD